MTISIFLFLLISGNAFSQAPPKKASRIIVITKDTSGTMLDQIALVLFDRGFTIETKDNQLKLLSTKERPSKKYATQSKIRVSINDTSIVFNSSIALGFQMNVLGSTTIPTYNPVEYTGSKNSAMREAWNEMAAIASLFGSKIFYSK